MKILVVNAGSSSLKYQLIDMADERVICKGGIESIGLSHSKLSHKINGKEIVVEKALANHTEAFNLLIDTLTSGEGAAIKDKSEINAIGHRVLHTGEDFTGSVVVDEEALKLMKKNIELGPLHMPANIKCIESCMEIFGDKIPNVAVFDTAFHMTMPNYAYMYAIRYRDYKKYKVRKYGFHGTSHKYVSSEAIKLLGNPKHSRIITCHLGNGSSITAVKDGKSVDTSMGLTPLEGVMMGTRSGDIDPAAVRFLMKKKRMTIDSALDYLNNKCGYLGVSEYSSDSRKVIEAARGGSKKAKLALEMSFYRIKKYIGAYAAAMNGVDCIVFTGGIGENSYMTRAGVMKDMEYLGIDFDFDKNLNHPRGARGELSKPDSKVKVYVIPTNEELVIARETKELVEK